MGPRHCTEEEVRERVDPREFEEPELYESMRLLREEEDEENRSPREGRKSRKRGRTVDQEESKAKRPCLDLEKMLKVCTENSFRSLNLSHDRCRGGCTGDRWPNSV